MSSAPPAAHPVLTLVDELLEDDKGQHKSEYDRQRTRDVASKLVQLLAAPAYTPVGSVGFGLSVSNVVSFAAASASCTTLASAAVSSISSTCAVWLPMSLSENRPPCS